MPKNPNTSAPAPNQSLAKNSLRELRVEDVTKIDREVVTWRSKQYFNQRTQLLRRKHYSDSLHRNDSYVTMRRQLLRDRKKKLAIERGDAFVRRTKVVQRPTHVTNLATATDMYTSTDLDTVSELSDDEDTFEDPRKPKITDDYAFVGMHHIFEHGSGFTSVNRIRFAYNDNSRLAYATSDGVLTLATALSDPPAVVAELKGHTKSITDFVWSTTNEYILSVSLDCKIILWSAEKAEKLRTIEESSPISSVEFHPLNNNSFVIGLANGYVKVFNLSTGKPFQQAKVGNPVTRVCFTPNGDLLFVGDAKGIVHVYRQDGISGGMIPVSKTQVSGTFKPVTSLSFNNYLTNGRISSPSLLVNSCDNSVCLLSVVRGGTLKTVRRFAIAHKELNVKSAFCPLISFRAGACFVSGSENCEVLVYDFTKDRRHPVNRLMGHGAPVIDVAWNYDESLLASCDKSGMIILWKRAVIEKKPSAKKQQQQQEAEKQKQAAEEAAAAAAAAAATTTDTDATSPDSTEHKKKTLLNSGEVIEQPQSPTEPSDESPALSPLEPPEQRHPDLISDDDFAQFMDNIMSMNFDEEREAAVSQLLATLPTATVFTCRHVQMIINTMEFSDPMVAVCERIAPRIVDIDEHYRTIVDNIPFYDDRQKIIRVFGKAA